MDISQSLQKLEQLTAAEMHRTNLKVRAQMAASDWRLAMCLFVTAERRHHWKFQCSSITEYGEKKLQLAPQKTGELIHTARVLLKHPALSDAFRAGKIGWGKMRELKRVVTPETELKWLGFALSHSTAEVRKKVALSPREWKRNGARQASAEGSPTVTEECVGKLLESEQAETRHTDTGKTPAAAPDVSADTQQEANDEKLPSPQKVRVVFHLTADEFALYEQAESRIRAKLGGRVSREKVLAEMSREILSQGDARSRARHQVLVHKDPETGASYYDTSRGPLPVDENSLVEALTAGKQKALANDEKADADGNAPRSARHKRRAVPNATVRKVFNRAGNCCERCGRRGGRLHIHHCQPVSDGGGDAPEMLLVLCPACHSLIHENDYAARPTWARARRRKASTNSKPKDPSSRGRSP